MVIAQDQSRIEVVGTYIIEGFWHIAIGFDHLLFVFGLLMIVRSGWMLIKTVTAFTVAHSITLALATLGMVQLPRPPVEVAIALSILFLAPEILRVMRGETSFTIRHPWVVAFAFGLLHGFGFAGVLLEVGLPRSELPLALLSFNIGVELGQLAFIAAVVMLITLLKTLPIRWPQWGRLVPAYLVGTLGAFWTIRALVLMLS